MATKLRPPNYWVLLGLAYIDDFSRSYLRNQTTQIKGEHTINLTTLQQLIEPRVAETPPARFILCERRDHWAVSLARAVPSIRGRLYETRSIPQAWEALYQSPASFLGLELTENNFELVALGLKQLSRDYPRARAIIFTKRALQHYEWILREAGAIDFLVSPRRIQQLAAMAERHIRLVQTDSPIGDQTIWQRLPWRPRHDTNKPTRVQNTDC